ncbi:MAG: NPN-dependent 2-hydroxyacid racemase, LarAH10 family [Desulfitobacteriaceae bacterium]
MNRFELAYGQEQLIFELPALTKVEEIKAKASQGIRDVDQAIRRALAHPLGTAPLTEVVKPGEKVVIIVSDITRLWVRTDILLPILLDVLNGAGVQDPDITIIIAGGDHRPHTRAEIVAICGEKVGRRVPIFDHDCHADDLVDLGFSSQGTRIKVNRRVWEADKVILTGGITHHLLAGFGGGRKSIAPGVCGYETIQQNHSLALKGGGVSGVNPNVKTGSMKENPVAADMLEIALKVGADFIINVVVNEKKEFVYIAAGALEQAHLAGCQAIADIYEIEIQEQADLVIVSSGGYPKDIQLYQSMKALDNAASAVREGGVIILVSECSDGIGSRPFQEFFQHGAVEEMNAKLHADFTMPGFVSLRTASIYRRSSVILISSVPDEDVKRMKMIPAHSPAEAMRLADKILGREPEFVYVMPHGGSTVPIVVETD